MPGVVANTEDDPGNPNRDDLHPRKLTLQYIFTKKSTMNEDVFPIETGDFPMSC